jgi:hypothetical protein
MDSQTALTRIHNGTDKDKGIQGKRVIEGITKSRERKRGERRADGKRGERENVKKEAGTDNEETETDPKGKHSAQMDSAKPLFLRWTEITRMLGPHDHLQSHSRPHPGKGGPAAEHGSHHCTAG